MRRLILLIFVLLFRPSFSSAAEASRETPASPAPSGVPTVDEGGALVPPDTGQYLPDTTVLARVNRRIVRVIDFRDRYYSSEALTRPLVDSLGRVEFLNNMVNKDVMGLTALAINRPLTLEDRITLRQYTNVAIQNVMHQRLVRDSITITEDDLRAVYPQYAYEQRLRGILFDDRGTAERVRADLKAGRISWKNAVARYSLSPARGPEGDYGWVKRWDVNGDFALKAFTTPPGGISEVVHDAEGYHVLQCVERRTVSPPSYAVMRRYIATDLRSARSDPLMQRMFQSVRTAAGVVYDTTNIRWATAKFQEVSRALAATRTSDIDMRTALPRFEPADTGRVLARTKDRRFTLNQFAKGYEAIPTALRRRITGFEAFVFTLDGMFLEPEILAQARAGGFDRDSIAVAMVEGRREEMLVEHLFSDSILSRVSVTPAMRKRYYRDHQKEFVSVPMARYARFEVRFEAAADSLVARLRAGQDPQAIITADSLKGNPSGSIEETHQNERSPLIQVLFEELRPGQVTKVGPTAEGHFLVVKLLAHQESRPMAYEEVESIVDESLQNIEAERLLKEFLARHRRRYKIEAHPELVMQIHLVDPALELRLN